MSQQTKINPNQLGTEVSKLLKEYSDDIVQKMPDIVKEVTQNTVKDLKNKAGKLFNGTTYKRSFKYKKQSTASGETLYTIYSTEYRIAHLLEHGHVIKNQSGILYGSTQARPHWQPAEEKAVEALEQKLTETVQEG